MILRLSLVLAVVIIEAVSRPLQADVGLDKFCEVAGKLQGAPMLVPQAIALDMHTGEIYVADTGNRRILILGRDGEAKGRFHCRSGEPVGIAVSSEGAIYVTASGSAKIDVYDYRGRFLRSIRPSHPELGETPVFGRMCTDAKDRLYVAVPNRHIVVCVDPEGKVTTVFGGSEQIEMVRDVCAGPDGTIYVLDSAGTPVVRRYDSWGRLLAGFGRHAELPQDFSLPTAIEVDWQERIWVVDSSAHVVKLFDREGRFLENFGTFYYPVDLAARSDGRLFVLEKGGGRLTCWRISNTSR